MKFSSQKNVTKGKILIVGPMQSGKSSLINSFASIYKDRICMITTEWKAANAVTKSYREFECGSSLLVDSMGSDYVDNSDSEEFLATVTGHIQNGYEFLPLKPISTTNPKYRSNPSNADTVHCVIFCFPAANMHDVPRVIEAKTKEMLRVLADLNIPFMFVLTKIDELSSRIRKDIKHTFWCDRLHQKVKETSEVFGVTEKLIYPLKNYTDECEVEYELNYLLLLAWRKAMELAQDRVEEM